MNVKQPTGLGGMAKYELPELGAWFLRRRFRREHDARVAFATATLPPFCDASLPVQSSVLRSCDHLFGSLPYTECLAGMGAHAKFGVEGDAPGVRIPSAAPVMRCGGSQTTPRKNRSSRQCYEKGAVGARDSYTAALTSRE